MLFIYSGPYFCCIFKRIARPYLLSLWFGSDVLQNIYLNNFPLRLISLAAGWEWNWLEIKTESKQSSCLVLAITCGIHRTKDVLQYNTTQYNTIQYNTITIVYYLRTTVTKKDKCVYQECKLDYLLSFTSNILFFPSSF